MSAHTNKLVFLWVILLTVFCVGLISSCNTSDDPLDTGGSDGDDPDGDDPDGDDPDGDDPDGDDPDGDDPDGDDPDGDDPTCEDYEDGCCITDADCLEGKCFDGVCAVFPTEEATVWWENSHYDDEEGDKVGDYEQLFDGSDPRPLDLSCTGGFENIDDAGTIDVRGAVVVFGVEAPCTGIQVEVFEAMDSAGNLRTDFSTENAVTTGAVTEAPDENFECHLTIPDVPKGRWLTIKSFDNNNINFRDTYMWNVYIKPEEDSNEEFEMEVHAISNTSWQLVPITAGVSNGIQSDRGAAAGTVKDCSGQLVKGATIGVSVRPTKIAYFNATVEDLLPQQGLTATNLDSTFSLVNQPAWELRVIALALIDGEVTKIGDVSYVQVKQSVAIPSFHGMGPINYGYFDRDTDVK